MWDNNGIPLKNKQLNNPNTDKWPKNHWLRAAAAAARRGARACGYGTMLRSVPLATSDVMRMLGAIAEPIAATRNTISANANAAMHVLRPAGGVDARARA